jgi:hypothetical protein
VYLLVPSFHGPFAGILLAQLRKLDYHIQAHVLLDYIKRINLDHLKALLDRREDLLWEGLDLSPHRSASERALFCRYLRWFARPPHGSYPTRVLRAPVPQSVLRTFIRFRLDCHRLPIDSGRQQGIPRSERICTRCNAGIVGHEHHLLFKEQFSNTPVVQMAQYLATHHLVCNLLAKSDIRVSTGIQQKTVLLLQRQKLPILTQQEDQDQYEPERLVSLRMRSFVLTPSSAEF